MGKPCWLTRASKQKTTQSPKGFECVALARSKGQAAGMIPLQPPLGGRGSEGRFARASRRPSPKGAEALANDAEKSEAFSRQVSEGPKALSVSNGAKQLATLHRRGAPENGALAMFSNRAVPACWRNPSF